jgi:hypothetical protein
MVFVTTQIQVDDSGLILVIRTISTVTLSTLEAFDPWALANLRFGASLSPDRLAGQSPRIKHTASSKSAISDYPGQRAN